jgi:hypothetical protein
MKVLVNESDLQEILASYYATNYLISYVVNMKNKDIEAEKALAEFDEWRKFRPEFKIEIYSLI